MKFHWLVVPTILLTFIAVLLPALNSAQAQPSDYKPTEREKYYFDELVNHSSRLLLYGFWSQKGSAWFEVPPSMDRKYSGSRDLAESCAKYLRKALGYMVCVHLYYGDFHQITRKCK